MSKKFLTLLGMAVLSQCAQAQIIMITDPSIAAMINADPRGDKIYAAPDGQNLQYFVSHDKTDGKFCFDPAKLLPELKREVCQCFYSTKLKRRLVFLSEGMVYYGTPVERRDAWANTFEDLMSAAEKANVDGRTASWPVWVTTSDARRAQIVAECNRRAATVVIPADSTVSADMKPEVTNMTDFGS